MFVLSARLPIRVSDALEIDVDPDATGKVLTPAQAIALGGRLIEQGVHRQAHQRRLMAALPNLGKTKVMA